jgi:hypothetical protein
MHDTATTLAPQSQPFGTASSRYAPIVIAAVVGIVLGASWALGMHIAALAPAAMVVLAFLLARWRRWFFVSLCALWLAPVILGVRFVSDLSLSDPAIFVLFLLFLARQTAEGKKIELRGPLFVPFLLLFGSQALSAAVMVYRSPGLFFYKDIFPFVRLIEAYLLCVMVGAEVKRGNLKPMLIGSGVVAAIAVGIGFAEHLGNYVIRGLQPFSEAVRSTWYNPFWESSGWPTSTLSRVGGTFEADPNRLGAFASMFAVVTFAFALCGSRRLIYRSILGGLFLIGLLTVIFTGSRGALLNSIVGLSGVILLSQRAGLPRKVVIAAALACLVVLFIVHFSPRIERFQALVALLQRGVGADTSFYGRVGVRWKLALEEFVRNPMVGRGPTVRLGKAADNLYVYTLVRFGVLGLLALGYVIWRVLSCGVWVWRSGRDELSRVTALALACALGGMLAQSLTLDLFACDRLRETYWIAFGVIAGMYELHLSGHEVGDAGADRLTHVS